MRPRSLQLVIAFDTTAAALAFEAAAPAAGLTGRLIPVPTAITAGCGLAWRDAPASRDTASALLTREGIAGASLYELVI